MSAPYALVQLAYTHAHPGSKMSFRKLNDTLQATLGLAIKSQMVFDKEDFAIIHKQFKGEHWFGTYSDWFLRLAVESKNPSAARSYLFFKGRKRFVWKKELLYEYKEICWGGKRVRVTSFNDDEGTVTLCEYKEGSFRAIKNRYTLTPAELKAGASSL